MSSVRHLHTANLKSRTDRLKNLLDNLRSTVNHMESSPLIASLEDGDRYICSQCDLPVKVCELNPRASCQFKVLESTELDLLRLMSRDLLAGKAGTCLFCGTPLSPQQLNRNPLRELCATCQSRAQKKRKRAL